MTVTNGTILVASARFRDVNSQDVVNVYNFRCDFTADQADLTVFSAVDAYLSSVYTEFDGYMDGDASAYDLKVDAVQFSGGKWVVVQNIGFGSWGGTLALSNAPDPLPGGSAILAKLGTGLGKHTGKKFLGMFGEDATTSFAKVTAGVLSAVGTGIVKLLTPHTIAAGNTLTTVILDRLDGTVRDAISISVSDTFAYQRRRRPGTGS